jgi:hypothetical protein
VGNYFDRFDAQGAGAVSAGLDGGNFFDQFDTAPAAGLSLPLGVTEVATPGRQAVVPGAFIGTQPLQSTAPTPSTLAGGMATLSRSGGNYFDRFDPPAVAPSVPDWITNPAPSIWGDAMQLLGLGGRQDVSPVPPVPMAGDHSGSAIGRGSFGENDFARFDDPLLSASPPRHFPYDLPHGLDGLDSTPASTAPATSGANAPENSVSGNAFLPRAAADAPGSGAVSVQPPSAQISRTPPKLLYSQLILGIKNASGGDYGKTRQWFADNGYSNLLRSNSPSQPSMFDRYWTMLGQYDKAKQEADAARKVGFGEAFAREGLRGFAGITELENRLLLPLDWGIDAASKAATGYDPRLSAIPDFEAEQRNSLAIQPYEEPTFLGKIGEATGQALPMVATVPLADAAIPAEGMSTVPEIAPTLWNAAKAIAAKIPRGVGSMTPAAALASQDAADQGGSLEDQIKAASITMASGAIPMLAESGASSLPLRIAERGAKSATLAIPVNAEINNLLNPNHKTTAGFTADDIASTIPQIIAGALTGGREAPLNLSAETRSSGGNPVWSDGKASGASPQFLDSMRTSLDAEKKWLGREGSASSDTDTRIPSDAAIWRKAPVEVTELESPRFDQLDLKDAWRAARTWVRRLFAVAAEKEGGILNRDTGDRLTSTGTFIDHGLRLNSEKHPNLRQHIHAAEVLDKLIERAVKLVDYAPSKGDREGAPNLLRIYRYVAPLRIGGRTFLIKLTAKRYAGDGQKYYDHRLTELSELTGEQEPSGQGVGPFAPRLRGDLKTARAVNVRDLLRGVKMSDISSTLPLMEPNWGDQFLDRMRAALDADAAAESALRANDITFSKGQTPEERVGRVWLELGRDARTAKLGETPTEKDFPSILRKLAGPLANEIEISEERAPNGEVWGYRFTEPRNPGRAIVLDLGIPGEAYVNSARAGEHSTPIYQAIYAWAHNNGHRIVEDPVGLSNIGQLRRTSQMLSSAIRYGTTRHIEPGPFSGIQGWSDGDGEADVARNIGLLARREAELVRERLPFVRQMRYAPEERAFYDGNQKLSAGDLKSYLRQRIAGIDPNFARGVGPATLKRALVTLAAERAESGGFGRLVGEPSKEAPLKDIRYGKFEKPPPSATGAQASAAGHVAAIRAAALDEAWKLRNPPSVVVHRDADSIGNDYLRRRMLEENAKGQGRVNALYHPSAHTIHLLADGVRDTAHAREMVRHEALHAAIRRNPAFRSEYTRLLSNLARTLPADTRQQLESLYGQGTPAQIMEEYLARLAEADPSHGIWRQFVTGFKLLASRFLGDRIHFNEADIREFIRRNIERTAVPVQVESDRPAHGETLWKSRSDVGERQSENDPFVDRMRAALDGDLEQRDLFNKSNNVGAANQEREEVKLLPFERGGGHHVPVKSAFIKAQNYDRRKALAIPNQELLRHEIDHALVTGAQQTLYRALARKSASLTWKNAEEIEIRALVHGGLDELRAKAVVRRAIRHLQNLGVENPTRIPWGN